MKFIAGIVMSFVMVSLIKEDQFAICNEQNTWPSSAIQEFTRKASKYAPEKLIDGANFRDFPLLLCLTCFNFLYNKVILTPIRI